MYPLAEQFYIWLWWPNDEHVPLLVQQLRRLAWSLAVGFLPAVLIAVNCYFSEQSMWYVLLALSALAGFYISYAPRLLSYATFENRKWRRAKHVDTVLLVVWAIFMFAPMIGLMVFFGWNGFFASGPYALAVISSATVDFAPGS